MTYSIFHLKATEAYFFGLLNLLFHHVHVVGMDVFAGEMPHLLKSLQGWLHIITERVAPSIHFYLQERQNVLYYKKLYSVIAVFIHI